MKTFNSQFNTPIIMKKTVLLFAMVFLPFLSFSQSIFDKFEGHDEVVAIVVNKKMFEMMGNVKTNDKESQQLLRLTKGLNNLKVFTTTDSKWSNEMKATVDSYLKKNTMEELMRVSDGSRSNVKIYIKPGNSSTEVKELLMFISGKDQETVLLSLTGTFDLNDLSALTEKMSLPGGEELKKASKSK